MESSLIIFLLSAILCLQVGITVLVYIGSKKFIKTIKLLRDDLKVMNLEANSSKVNKNIKSNTKTEINEYKGKVPPLKDDEELIFIKDMKIDRKKRFIEMNIDVDRKK